MKRCLGYVAAAVVLLVGCSSEKKALRLREEMDEACAYTNMAGRLNIAVPKDEQAKCDAATRKFNKFMD